MELINTNRPVLLLHPQQSSNSLQQRAVTLTDELTNLIGNIDFNEASSKHISKVIRIAKRGIERILALEGSVQIISTDSLQAEAILNKSLEILAKALNEAMCELKSRSTELGNQDDFYLYLQELDSMIEVCLHWSHGRASDTDTNTPMPTLNNLESKYL